MSRIWTVSAEFACRDEARAFADLVEEVSSEVGSEVEVEVWPRQLSSGRGREGVRRPVRETRMGRLILGRMDEVPGRTWEKEDFFEVVEERGYLAASVSPILTYLVQGGDVERVGRGLYRRRRVGDGAES